MPGHYTLMDRQTLLAALRSAHRLTDPLHALGGDDYYVDLLLLDPAAQRAALLKVLADYRTVAVLPDTTIDDQATKKKLAIADLAKAIDSAEAVVAMVAIAAPVDAGIKSPS